MHRRAFAAGSVAAAILPVTTPQAKDPMLIDDFSSRNGIATTGNRWMGFTDQVMGGRSTGGAEVDEIEGRPCIRLSGQVNTRGGGFIQLALDLGQGRQPFDASTFKGMELDVYGNNESYNCHLRTTDVRWYEQSYRASFKAPAKWTTIKLQWTDFEPHGLSVPLNLEGLLRLGILGWMRDYYADIAVGRVALI